MNEMCQNIIDYKSSHGMIQYNYEIAIFYFNSIILLGTKAEVDPEVDEGTICKLDSTLAR